ncbi:unnamed protein product (macronuclear) [Paramecium tetraurelia]|uniref:Uncharacterized protein n=1 Tax=Paramecium tetraurelia TaxID=5888 RepID=A0DUI4_PARTE|nr:uncharacterized protein GSPATT00020373001 [Paramecium tetraurelia]CAK86701.1 unnamed protein product [Paramecium tetraurelia]|eukprot:XP_001454098.1 hypothetical protein (macronuclear) [Paramecium tetraurelia strain d4-2]
MKAPTHRCLLSSLIESNEKTTRQAKTHESFERLKNSQPQTATPKTQMTSRKSKQMSLVQVQQLIQQPLLRKNHTALSEVPHTWNTSRSIEKTVDLLAMSQHKRVKWLEKQKSLLAQQQPVTERVQTSRIKQMATAANYNNFLKKFNGEYLMILDKNKTAAPLQKVQNETLENNERQFIFKQPLRIVKGLSEHMLRMKSITRQHESLRSPPRKFSNPRYQLTNANRVRFSKYYQDDSLKVLKSQKRDPNQIFKELHIEDIQYTDLDRAQNHPINIALFNMLKDEEIILKQQQLEEAEKYTAQELIKQRQEIERFDELTRQEYHRKCYVDFKSKVINPKYQPNYLRLDQSLLELFPKNQVVNSELQKKLRRHKILNMIKMFLFRLHELHLNLEDLIKHKIYPLAAYANERSKLFFDLVKSNKIELTRRELQENRYLVYEFDPSKLTPLHHAVIRNHVEMVELLMEYHADVNRRDILGRTPLFFGIRSGYNDCVQQLLYHQAIPWSNKKNQYDLYLDMLSDKVRDQYRKSKNYHLQMQMMPYTKRAAFWVERRYYFTQ